MKRNYSEVLGNSSKIHRRRDSGCVSVSKQNSVNAWLQRRSFFSKINFVRNGDDSISRHASPPQQRLQLQDYLSQRYFSSSRVISDKGKNTDLDNDSAVVVDYTSPLGDLISRLKMVSITGCFLSVCVLPALVFLKNGDLPSARQVTLGTFATLGASGSTVALHFVFGAYVLEMKSIAGNDDSDGDDNDNDQNRHLLEATTRSVFGFWKNTHVFDPRTDVTPYVGARPFANFCANEIPLYVHPERLDATTRQLLLHSSGHSIDNSAASSTDNIEGIPKEHRVVNEGSIKKKKNDDDDLF
eukprot:jgi/Psemu1/260039/estExt_Genewise1Plus.C_4100009